MEINSNRTILLPENAWMQEVDVTTTKVHFEISDAKGYGNGRRPETYGSANEAIAAAKKKITTAGEYNDYHNSQREVITKVTVITEIIRIVSPLEKH